MKQKRLTDNEKIEMCNLYDTGNYTFAALGRRYGISAPAAGGLLKRRGYTAKPQTALQRKYFIEEAYFDNIDTEEKAYFLGFLYADGYNNEKRNSVSLGLVETDKDILTTLNNLVQPEKPLQYVKTQSANSKNQYRLVMANKRISRALSALGCTAAKTYTLTFPTDRQVPSTLLRHFVRGYFDGDGWVGIKSVCLVGTLSFCESLSQLLKKELGVNSYIRARHPERNNNIRSLELNAKQARIFLKWMYQGSTISLKRKYERYSKQMVYEKSIGVSRLCQVESCTNKHLGRGHCRKHYYQKFGREKRKERYRQHGC